MPQACGAHVCLHALVVPKCSCAHTQIRAPYHLCPPFVLAGVEFAGTLSDFLRDDLRKKVGGPGCRLQGCTQFGPLHPPLLVPRSLAWRGILQPHSPSLPPHPPCHAPFCCPLQYPELMPFVRVTLLNSGSILGSFDAK